MTFKLESIQVYVLFHPLIPSPHSISTAHDESKQVVDARTTMAIYRLHKKDWERASESISRSLGPKLSWPQIEDSASIFKTMIEKEEVEDAPPTSNTYRKTSVFPVDRRKGASSGMSTVRRLNEQAGWKFSSSSVKWLE